MRETDVVSYELHSAFIFMHYKKEHHGGPTLAAISAVLVQFLRFFWLKLALIQSPRCLNPILYLMPLQEFLHYFPTDFTVGQFRSLNEDELHYKHGIKNAAARAKFMAVLSRTTRKPRDHAMRSSVGSMTPMSPIGPPVNPGA